MMTFEEKVQSSIEAYRCALKILQENDCKEKAIAGVTRMIEGCENILEGLKDENLEIVEPEYDWEKIIKDKVLCIFWDYYNFHKKFGYLMAYDEKNIPFKFIRDNGTAYLNCKPITSIDVNIAKDLKENKQ